MRGWFFRNQKLQEEEDGTVAVDDDKIHQQLLGSNQFVANLPQSAAGKSNPVVSAPDRTAKKKQPPLVVENVSFSALAGKIVACNAVLIYKLTRFGTEIQCTTAEDVNKVQMHLQQHDIEYFTYDKPEERPYCVMLRQFVLKKKHGIVAAATHIIRRKEANDESFYLLHFPKGYTNFTKLCEVRNIGQIRTVTSEWT